jgi:hypothetical protein
MPSTLEDITTGIKQRLATIDGVRASAVEPANPQPVAAWPFLRTADYDVAFDGAMRWEFSVYVMVALAVNANGQTNLMPFLAPTGAKSVKAAIEADPTLGGVADSTRVTRIDGVGSYAIAGSTLYGAVLICEVLT